MKIFDAHFHIINPMFPLVENNGYLPGHFSVEDYREKVRDLEVVGGAIVSGSFQGFDQEYLLDALLVLGQNYCGVANIPLEMKKEDLRRLDESNVRAVRFNLKRGGSEGLENLVVLANRLFDNYGWVTELYLDSKHLRDLRGVLQQIPMFSIDHLGLSREGLNELYYWAEKGAKIKATGFGRLDFDPLKIMERIFSINPDSLMFGTDLPSTRAKVPFSRSHMQGISDTFSISEQEKVFYQNAYDWYWKR